MPNRVIQSLINGFRGLGTAGKKLTAPARIQVTQQVQEVQRGGRVTGVLLQVFNDPWQVVAFVITISIVGLLAYSGYAGIHWAISQPKAMYSDLNIAVADFKSASGAVDEKVASIASLRIARVIDNEFSLISNGMDIEVSNKNMPVVSNRQEAEELAEHVKAHIVIYGVVEELDGQAQISPAFYIAPRFHADLSEITGLDGLAKPVDFATREILDEASTVNESLRQKSTILIEFTKALAYLSADQFNLAEESIETTLGEAAQYPPLSENVVFLLVASTIARERKDYTGAQSYLDRILTKNSTYGRAFVAMGNFHYAQEDFDEALAWYEKALGLTGQPYTAHIQEKAHLGIGSVYTYLFQLAPKGEGAEFSDIALKHLDAVIASDEGNPEAIDDELAALAYYDLGLIAQWDGKYATAKRYYKKALALTNSLELLQRAEKRYNGVRWYFFD